MKDTTEIDYVINTYEPCVANKMIENNQYSLTWHADDVKSSHLNPEVNDNFEQKGLDFESQERYLYLFIP